MAKNNQKHKTSVIGKGNAGAVELAARNTKSLRTKLDWTPRAINNTRKDIADWKRAIRQAEDTENPVNHFLQTIYLNISQDALLTSQIENRQTKLFGVGFNLKNLDGSANAEQTEALRNSVAWREITKAILETHYFEYSLIQLDWLTNVDGTQRIGCTEIPRTNIVPQRGLFFPDILDPTRTIRYREEKEYGVWWLEFGSAANRALLNKAVPHVLMKSFAQSCWAELCEIYGIPPRYMKTNTQDPAMLKRAEKMMKDMGAAAWFIIDDTEDFQFADGVNTNGDVYKNLIALCNNENSMLVSGAIIGQDTKNGNRSKDESAQEVLWELVMQDLVLVEDNWNNIVIPALKKIGVISGDVKFRFEIPEDLELLWNRVKDTLNHYEHDVEWLNEKFGLRIIGKKETPQQNNLSHGESFFV